MLLRWPVDDLRFRVMRPRSSHNKRPNACFDKQAQNVCLFLQIQAHKNETGTEAASNVENLILLCSLYFVQRIQAQIVPVSFKVQYFWDFRGVVVNLPLRPQNFFLTIANNCHNKRKQNPCVGGKKIVYIFSLKNSVINHNAQSPKERIRTKICPWCQ